MKRDPAYQRFLSILHGTVSEAYLEWATDFPGRPFAPEVATALAARCPPTNRQGQIILNLDEQLWAARRIA